MKRRTQSETKITQEIIQSLQKRGFLVKRIYNGGVPGGINIQTKQIRYRKKPQRDKGIPDLLAYNLKKKLFLFIEVKSLSGKVSFEQEEFNKAFNSCNQFCALYCRSKDDIEKFLQIL